MGSIPSGFPSATNLFATATGGSTFASDLGAVLPSAVVMAVVGFMEAISVAKVLEGRYPRPLDSNQELVGLGAANAFASFFGGFPGTGAFSRTSVNADAGAKTPVTSIVSAVILCLTVLFLTPLFYHLPRVTLGCMIIFAVIKLFDVETPKMLWAVSLSDFVVFTSTFLATVVLGIRNGILIGAVISLARLIREAASPEVVPLGRVPGTQNWRDIRRFGCKGARPEPGVAVVRFESHLFFANAGRFRDLVLGLSFPAAVLQGATMEDEASLAGAGSQVGRGSDLGLGPSAVAVNVGGGGGGGGPANGRSVGSGSAGLGVGVELGPPSRPASVGSAGKASAEDIETDSPEEEEEDEQARAREQCSRILMEQSGSGQEAGAAAGGDELLSSGLAPEAVVVDCSVMSQLDSSALDALEQLPKDLKKRARDIRDARIGRLEGWLQDLAAQEQEQSKGGDQDGVQGASAVAEVQRPPVAAASGALSIQTQGGSRAGGGDEEDDDDEVVQAALQAAQQSAAFRELLAIETTCGGAVSADRARAMGEVTRHFLEAEMAWYRKRFGPLSVVEEAALLDIHDPSTDWRYRQDAELLRARLVELGRVPLKIPKLYLACLRGKAQEMLRRNDEYVARVQVVQRRARRRTLWTCQWPCEVTNPCEHLCWEGCCVGKEVLEDENKHIGGGDSSGGGKVEAAAEAAAKESVQGGHTHSGTGAQTAPVAAAEPAAEAPRTPERGQPDPGSLPLPAAPAGSPPSVIRVQRLDSDASLGLAVAGSPRVSGPLDTSGMGRVSLPQLPAGGLEGGPEGVPSVDGEQKGVADAARGGGETGPEAEAVRSRPSNGGVTESSAPEGTEDVGFAGQRVSHDVALLSYVVQDDDLHEAVEKVRQRVLRAALADLARWGTGRGEVVSRREEQEAGGFVSAGVWKDFMRQRSSGTAASRVDLLEGVDLGAAGLRQRRGNGNGNGSVGSSEQKSGRAADSKSEAGSQDQDSLGLGLVGEDALHAGAPQREGTAPVHMVRASRDASSHSLRQGGGTIRAMRRHTF